MAYSSDDTSDDGTPYLLDAGSSYTDGLSAYTGDTSAADTGGVINASATPLPTAPDASGGNGSFPSSLQQILTSGLSDTGVLATEFGLGTLTDRLTIGANAQASPAGSPSDTPVTTSSIPWGLLLIAALGLFLVVKIAKD